MMTSAIHGVTDISIARPIRLESGGYYRTIYIKLMVDADIERKIEITAFSNKESNLKIKEDKV